MQIAARPVFFGEEMLDRNETRGYDNSRGVRRTAFLERMRYKWRLGHIMIGCETCW